jgi:hypothetical protein
MPIVAAALRVPEVVVVVPEGVRCLRIVHGQTRQELFQAHRLVIFCSWRVVVILLVVFCSCAAATANAHAAVRRVTVFPLVDLVQGYGLAHLFVGLQLLHEPKKAEQEMPRESEWWTIKTPWLLFAFCG